MKKLQCTGCGQVKGTDQFYRDKGSKDGFESHCKECRREYKKHSKVRDKERANLLRYIISKSDEIRSLN